MHPLHSLVAGRRMAMRWNRGQHDRTSGVPWAPVGSAGRAVSSSVPHRLGPVGGEHRLWPNP